MSKKLIECLEQVSPLINDAVSLMRSMKLNPSEHIALGFLICAEFSMRAALSLPSIEEELTEEQRENIIELLAKKKREADEVIQVASQKFMNGWKLQ